MFFGLLLIIIGIVFLLENLGIVTGDIWDVIWPLIIILFGVSVITKPLLGSKGKKSKKE
ncbi:MAG: DUF5668 domain-containing protein [Patescibacteria group bacterium]|jgi:uncharacterized integral membrane protein